MLTLEQSVAELHQMFLDFALLTEQQGELLDQIEFQVKQAGDYVEEANVDVHQAIEYQKSIRKKQWYVSSRVFLHAVDCRRVTHLSSISQTCISYLFPTLQLDHSYRGHCDRRYIVCHRYHQLLRPTTTS